MIDLLTLTGSTAATAELLNTSQPTVSRRARALATDLGLQRQRASLLGRYGDTPWLRWLRRGVNHQRLSHGVLRIGGARDFRGLFAEQAWAQWVPLGLPQQRLWPSLLELEYLDAVAIGNPSELSGLNNAPFHIVEPKGDVPQRVVLVCRQDPMVLEVSGRIGF